MKTQYGVGIMSGTSLDGIDVALVKIEGQMPDIKLELIDFYSEDMDPKVRERILNLSDPEKANLVELTSMNLELGYLFSKAVSNMLEQTSFKGNIDFIASHGQTIYHNPVPAEGHVKSTLQIGDPSPIAFEHNVPVIFNFRMMDIVAGGEGAPLVPFTEYVVYSNSKQTRLLQNIGGIGNVTILDKNASLNDVWAFDTGPGNMMMNTAVEYFYNQPYDKDAQYAKQGKLIDELYDSLITDPYLDIVPPKSTGREYYTKDKVENICKKYDNANDVIYTLTYFTAYTIADSYRKFIFGKHDVDEIIIGGGGAYNPLLMELIQSLLPEYKVMKQEDLGFNSDAKEAIAFALLGYTTLNNECNNVPAATGAKEFVILGQIQPKPKK